MSDKIEDDVWRDVVANRGIVKWLKDEFPELLDGDAPAAPEGHPGAHTDAIQISRTPGVPGHQCKTGTGTK
jgi:hypothetical protein